MKAGINEDLDFQTPRMAKKFSVGTESGIHAQGR